MRLSTMPASARAARRDAPLWGERMAGSRQPSSSVMTRRWERAEVERDALYRLARSVGLSPADADDCVQEAIVSVVPRPDVDEARIGALLSTAVRRRAIDLYRRSETARRAS